MGVKKTKHRVFVFLSFVVFIAAILCTWLICRNYNLNRYQYVANETEFTFQLVDIVGHQESKYELTPDGRLIFPVYDPNIKSEEWTLSNVELEHLANYIITEKKFFKWKNEGEYSEEEYNKTVTNFENRIVILTVTFNGETKIIGGIDWVENDTLYEIFYYLRRSQEQKTLLD